jgi:uncharacterized membrane protein YoaK (UPF0700 family)
LGLQQDHPTPNVIEGQELEKFTIAQTLQGPHLNQQQSLAVDLLQNEQSRGIHFRSHDALAALSSSITKQPSRAFLVNIGCLFSLNSGFLNGLGLSGALGQYASVSAVTGTYTNAAVAFANGDSHAMLTVLATPLFYVLGSFFNGLCNPEGSLQSWDKICVVQSAPLFLAGTLVLVASWTPCLFVRLACLTVAMGLQNSWTSTMMPGNLLRTAHFSGLTSDIGTVLGQTLRGNHANTYKLSIFAKLVACFWLGGVISVVGIPMLGVAPSTCFQLSALWYFAVWSAVTNPLRQTVASTVESVQRSLQTGIPDPTKPASNRMDLGVFAVERSLDPATAARWTKLDVIHHYVANIDFNAGTDIFL